MFMCNESFDSNEKFNFLIEKQLLDKRIVKASFRDCSIEDRKNFKNSNCLIPISVGQMVHEGKKFLATIQLINKYFKNCTILIDDSVQRHTIQISSPMEESVAYELSMIAGDQWLERNKVYYEQLTIPFEIIRWDKWLLNDGFSEKHKIIEDLYANSIIYREALKDNACEFLDRQLQNNKQIYFHGKDRAFDLCIKYLKEECAGMCLWAEYGYNYEVYPGGRNKSMEATYNHIIKEMYPNTLISVALRFKKNKSRFNNQNQESLDEQLILS